MDDLNYYTSYEDIILNGGEPLVFAQQPVKGWKLYVCTKTPDTIADKVKAKYETKNPNKRLLLMTLKYVDSPGTIEEITRQMDLELRDLGIAQISSISRAKRFFDIILIKNARKLVENRGFWNQLINANTTVPMIFFDTKKLINNDWFSYLPQIEVPSMDDNNHNCCHKCSVM